MSDYLYRIVQGFATLENITQSMMDIDTKTAEINTISTGFRSQAELQETTNQISSTGKFIRNLFYFGIQIKNELGNVQNK